MIRRAPVIHLDADPDEFFAQLEAAAAADALLFRSEWVQELERRAEADAWLHKHRKQRGGTKKRT